MHFAAALFALSTLTNPFCDDIAKLVEGGREPIPFQTLRDADFRPMLLGRGCFPGGVSYFCQQSMLPPEITRDGMASRIAACLPDSKIAVEKPPADVPRAVVSGSGLRFSLVETGADRAHVGRILRIEIAADR
ncbi:MAG: hypothetical protein KF730_11205 [Sphingomonas sp.]|uniref:hypothetical protein n=1 Tax=Sphingomonas sp. TaxID=28214 RepID=UPI0025FFA356|nr:hypothetical protein [Sphingomonas sp.]MBX3565128.1 hypothetical protein [Sphingomonas sp.]